MVAMMMFPIGRDKASNAQDALGVRDLGHNGR